MGTLQGTWLWYELMTGDPAGARAFYEAVVGWRIVPGAEPPLFYGHITMDGVAVGGVLPIGADMRAGGARPGWVGYLGVDDVDAAVAGVLARGGSLLMPKATIDVGSFAMVRDCCGAPFYLMTPTGEGTSTAFSPDGLGRCGWNELRAGNAANAIAFYTGLFGWSLPEPMDMGPMGKYQFIAHAGVNIGAIMQKSENDAPPHWNHYFRVASTAAAKTAIVAHGGQVVNGPHQVPTGDWVLQGIDPEGAFFCLVGGA